MKKILISILIFPVLTSGGITLAENLEKVDFEDIKCKDSEVQLITNDGIFVYSNCLNKNQYKQKKKYFKEKQIENFKKGYDFDINEWPTVLSIFYYEIKQKGGLEMEGMTKEKLKTELLLLLN